MFFDSVMVLAYGCKQCDEMVAMRPKSKLEKI